MGRDRIRTTELNVDHAYGIRKLCNGNLKHFYDKYIRGEIEVFEFYKAMKPLEPITNHTEQVIDMAYFEALSDFGLNNDTLSILPTLSKLLGSLSCDIQLLGPTSSSHDVLVFRERYSTALRFYERMIEEGIIKFEKTKKSTIV